jgi:hypothetical protein
MVQKRPKIEAAKNSSAAIIISRMRQRILKEFSSVWTRKTLSRKMQEQETNLKIVC